MSMSCLWKEPMASASEPPPMQKRSDTWGHGRLEDYLRLFRLAAAWDAAQHTAFFRHPRPSATCWPAPLRSKLRHWLRPSARRLGAEMLPDPVDVAADLASTQQLQQPSLAGCRVQAGVVGPLCFHPQSQTQIFVFFTSSTALLAKAAGLRTGVIRLAQVYSPDMHAPEQHVSAWMLHASLHILI